MKMTFHLNHVETIFFVVSVISMIISVYALREAMLDQAVRSTVLSDPAKIIADAGVRQEWFKIAISIAMLIASGAALFLEPPPPGYQQVPQSLVFAIAWIIVGVIMITSSLLDRSLRHKLIALRTRRATDQFGQRRAGDLPGTQRRTSDQ